MRDHSIDVVVPLYNKAPYVEQAIASALAQTHRPRTVLVADDASTDGSRELVAAMARRNRRIRLLPSEHEHPRGAGSARNRAVSVSSAAFVAFLDADDFWEPGKLEAQIALFDDPRVGTVHCGIGTADRQGGILGVFEAAPLPPPDTLFDEIRLGRYYLAGSSSTLVTRRDILLAAGRFREDIEFAEDWDMWARLAAQAGFAVVPTPLSYIRTLDTRWQTASREERFARWLGVLDRWKDDEAFLRRAETEARGIVARHQLGLILEPRKMLMEYPRAIARHGGTIGARLYGSRWAYLHSVLTLVPAAAHRALRKLLRASPR